MTLEEQLIFAGLDYTNKQKYCNHDVGFKVKDGVYICVSCMERIINENLDLKEQHDDTFRF